MTLRRRLARFLGGVAGLETWKKGAGSSEHDRVAREPAAPAVPRRVVVPREFLPLHKYLDDRFASTVALTFSEIEDLLGCALPDLARLRQEWWANADADSTPSAQSRSWTEASRTATANLPAQTVAFERASL